jgi:hypothetical protein
LADIFISYSKANRDNVVTLAAYLESAGWPVCSGDARRDEILREREIAHDLAPFLSERCEDECQFDRQKGQRIIST